MSGWATGRGTSRGGDGLRHRGAHPRDERKVARGLRGRRRGHARREERARLPSRAEPDEARRDDEGRAGEHLHDPEEGPEEADLPGAVVPGTASTPASSSSRSRSPGTCPTSTATKVKQTSLSDNVDRPQRR
ncbi:MAG: hypothetical protein MZV64_11330 [Ignavibacteriales bacterium]|nr:hypothetical protein [Ignavibacteriales bacterium]